MLGVDVDQCSQKWTVLFAVSGLARGWGRRRNHLYPIAEWNWSCFSQKIVDFFRGPIERGGQSQRNIGIDRFPVEDALKFVEGNSETGTECIVRDIQLTHERRDQVRKLQFCGTLTIHPA